MGSKYPLHTTCGGVSPHAAAQQQQQQPQQQPRLRNARRAATFPLEFAAIRFVSWWGEQGGYGVPGATHVGWESGPSEAPESERAKARELDFERAFCV